VFLGQLIRRFYSDNITRSAASLSYSTLLALVPFLIVMYYILAPFPLFKGIDTQIQHFIVNNFVSDLATNVNAQLSVFLKQMSTLRWTNILALAVVNILMMFNLVQAYNSIWHVRLRYNYALAFLFYAIVLLISPLVFASLLFLGPYLASIKLLLGSGIYGYVSKPFLKLIPFFSAVVVFTLFNWLLPSTKVKLRYAFVCGSVTAILFDAAKYLFAYYVKYFSSYKMIYGALAIIPFFLVWIYLSWLIILLGALMCNIMSVGLEKSMSYYERLVL